MPGSSVRWSRPALLVPAAVLALVLLVACASGAEPQPDPDRPTVTTTQPIDGTTGIALDTTIRVTFSRAMGRDVTESAFAVDPSVVCAFSWNTAGTVLTCTPDAPLALDTAYTVTVGSAAEDADGTALASDHVFTFTTSADPPDPSAPTVVATIPSGGATGVAVSTVIGLTFSIPMDTAATEGAFGITPDVTCALTWNATETALTCTPASDLEADASYTVNVGTDAESATGTSLETAFEFTFTTAPAVVESCTFGTSAFGACRFGP